MRGWVLREHRDTSVSVIVLVISEGVEKNDAPLEFLLQLGSPPVLRTSPAIKWKWRSGPPAGAASCKEPVYRHWLLGTGDLALLRVTGPCP